MNKSAEIDRLRDALRTALEGGNSLATVLIGWFGGDFAQKYPADAEPNEVCERMGYSERYEVWLCWWALMQAKRMMAEVAA